MIVQLALDARLVPQLLDCAKGPLKNLMLEMLSKGSADLFPKVCGFFSSETLRSRGPQEEVRATLLRACQAIQECNLRMSSNI